MQTTQHIQQKFDIFAQKGARIQPIFTEVAQRLCDRLLDTKHTFSSALDLGAGMGSVAQAIPPFKKPDFLIEADFSAKTLQNNPSATKLILNVEAPLPFNPQTFDLITANMLLPWVQNVPRFLAQTGRILKKDGLFLASTLGDESFKELRHAFQSAGSPYAHTNPMPNIQTVGAALQKVGFALPVIDRDMITLEYKNMADLWADLKAMGATNLHPGRRRGLMTKALLKHVEEGYQQQFGQDDGTIPLTLEVIYLHGWRPHKTQQKPLPRGSGKVDLSAVLN